MRIAIVNDMLMAVEAMRRVIIAHSGHQVVWVARDGEEAVHQCERDRPDLILMDLVMPRMDGIEATRRIMAKTPCAIVIVTASVNDHTAKVFEAMGAGALDAVNTPVLGGATSAEGPKSLLAKIDTIRRLIAPTAWQKASQCDDRATHPLGAKNEPLVCIGTSAGGPAALARLLSGLPADFPAAIVIVQHVDAQFARGLADWLASHAKLPVRLAEEGDRLQPGVVLLAGRDHHLVLASPHRLGYSRATPDCAYRPSVDVFFKSVAQHCKGTAIGVLLTGMGRDGAEGLLAMRQQGFFTLAQDEASSAVYGMPKAAADLQAAAEILTLDKIAPRLVNVLAHQA
jgi:two-component system response regulator WspF